MKKKKKMEKKSQKRQKTCSEPTYLIINLIFKIELMRKIEQNQKKGKNKRQIKSI